MELKINNTINLMIGILILIRIAIKNKATIIIMIMLIMIKIKYSIVTIKTCTFSPQFSDQVDDLTPEKYASALSRLVFAWLDPLVVKGWKKQLGRSDLWSLQHDNKYKLLQPSSFYKRSLKQQNISRHNGYRY